MLVYIEFVSCLFRIIFRNFHSLIRLQLLNAVTVLNLLLCLMLLFVLSCCGCSQLFKFRSSSNFSDQISTFWEMGFFTTDQICVQSAADQNQVSTQIMCRSQTASVNQSLVDCLSEFLKKPKQKLCWSESADFKVRSCLIKLSPEFILFCWWSNTAYVCLSEADQIVQISKNPELTVFEDQNFKVPSVDQKDKIRTSCA